MFDIKKAKVQSESFSLRQIEEEIDNRINLDSIRGYFSTTFIISNCNITKYKNYKEVSKKYIKEGYKVSYGNNHNHDYLITINWKEE